MRMTRISCIMSPVSFLLMILFRGGLVQGSQLQISPNVSDTNVSCVFMERCILPCSFTFGSKVAIHWIQLIAGHPRVHEYYNKTDHLEHQDQRFRGRTSLFKEQIPRGNASLQLTGVKVQDQGRYMCLTSTTRREKESFINLKVDAPVHEVNIDQVGNRIICSSNWIYPKPELTWSITPPSKETFKNTTTVQQTEQQLYNINSTLKLSDSDNDLVYTCTISTQRNKRRASFIRLSSIIVSKAETTISCFASNTSLTNFSLVWRFNHSQIILNRTRTDVSFTVSEEWRQHVKNVSESGSLTLQDLSSNQEGIYTCELSDDEETLRSDTSVRTNATDVSCVFMERCILPCSFIFHPEELIRWRQVTSGYPYVHEYYNKKDHYEHQDQRFRGRTSLFKEQIPRGNASLQLTGVNVQDNSRFICHTWTNNEDNVSFINLKVDAPVHEVNIDQVGNRITCSSNWIYPEPELTWSTRPPSKETFKNTTTVQQTEQQLYNISSSLILSDSDNDLVYSCTISTQRNKRRATFRRLPSIIVSNTETTISCFTSNTSLTNFSLVWRFNHSQIILNRTRTDVSSTVSEEWRQQVKDVSESGSLTLQDLSSNQDGIYTCELSDDEETLRTDTLVRVEKENSVIVGVILVAVLLIIAVAAGLVYHERKKGQQENNCIVANECIRLGNVNENGERQSLTHP